MKVKVIGNVQAKNEYGYVGDIPRGDYTVSILGMVFLKGIINNWTMFLSIFQEAVKEGIIEVVDEPRNMNGEFIND